MPQMSPINWVMMFILFMIVFTAMMNKVYFYTLYAPLPLQSNPTVGATIKLNWMW